MRAIRLALLGLTAFAAAAAAGSMAGVAASALFAIAYSAAARRAGWLVSLLTGSVVFTLAAAALHALPLSAEPIALAGVYLAGVSVAVAAIIAIPRPAALEEAPPPPAWDLPARMIVATVLVLAITSAAPLLGPQLSGLITTYPIYASVLGVFAHMQRGSGAATQVMRGLCYGILAFATFFLTIGMLVDRLGIAVAFPGAAAAALVVQALTLTRVRTRATPSPTG